MQRLNIPLHRYQNTTRLPRRVVSLLIGLLIGLGALTVIIGSLWFGHDGTSRFAPQDTSMVFHFQPNRMDWGDMQRALGKMTLVSNRPLTVTDIRTFVSGEFSVFINKDGIRSVAVRTSDALIPIETLDSLGILTERVANGVFLLSDRPTARMNWNPKHIWFGTVHWPGNKRIGDFYLVENQKIRGAIYSTKEGMSIRLPNQHLPKLQTTTVPDRTILALATPLLPNIEIGPVTQSIDNVLLPYQAPTSSDLVEQLRTASGAIYLTKPDEQGDSVDFLVTLRTNPFNSEQQHQILQTAAALRSPKFQSFLLPDNTTADEILVDPSMVSLEETTVAGTLVYRSVIGTGEYLFSTESQGFAITNSQELLEFALNGKGKEQEPSRCKGNALIFSIGGMIDTSSASLTSRTAGYLELLNQEYSSLAIEQGWISTTIKLCH